MHYKDFQYTTSPWDDSSIYMNITPTKNVYGNDWHNLDIKLISDFCDIKNFFFRYNIENVISESDHVNTIKNLELAEKFNVKNTYCAFVCSLNDEELALNFHMAIAENYSTNLIMKAFVSSKDADLWLSESHKNLK